MTEVFVAEQRKPTNNVSALNICRNMMSNKPHSNIPPCKNVGLLNISFHAKARRERTVVGAASPFVLFIVYNYPVPSTVYNPDYY